MTDIANAAVPALVLTGEGDFINSPAEGEAVASALPNAAFTLVPNAQHEAYDGNPEFVFEQIDAFLEQFH